MKEINKLSDDQLDDLFRSASEQEIPEFSESAWLDMQNKLDEYDRKRRFAGFWKIATVLMLVGTLGLGINYFSGNINNSTENTNVKVEQDSQPSAINQSKNEGPLLNKEQDIVLEKTRISNIETLNAATIAKAEKVNSTLQKTIKSKANKNLNHKNSIKNNDLRSSGALKSEGNNKSVNSGESIINAISDNNNEVNKNEIVALRSESDVTSNKNNDGLNNNKIVNNELLEIIEEDTVEVSFEDTKVAGSVEDKVASNDAIEPDDFSTENSKSIIKRRPSLILGVSPDYSKVKASEMNEMGTNFQVLVNFPISKRLNLKSGLIFSNKKYNTQATDYAMPEKWQLNSNKLVSVGANCNLLDIPLLLSYDLTQNTKNNFYGSLGLTSYKMLNETFSFNYENNNDPNIIMSQWKGDSKFLPFGLLNVSLGYERRLNSKLSVQVEPFLKSPIKQIGMGLVKLESYGVFINLKINALK